MTTPFAVTVVRTRKRRPVNGPGTAFRKLQREYLKDESISWFVIELLLFGLLAAISAGSLFRAFEAMRSL
jgi:hypothetical protein